MTQINDSDSFWTGSKDLISNHCMRLLIKLPTFLHSPTQIFSLSEIAHCTVGKLSVTTKKLSANGENKNALFMWKYCNCLELIKSEGKNQLQVNCCFESNFKVRWHIKVIRSSLSYCVRWLFGLRINITWKWCMATMVFLSEK